MNRTAKVAAALPISEEKFRSVFEDAAIGMVMADLDGKFMKINPAMCKMVGYTENELLAKTIMDITHIDDLSESWHNVAKLTRGEIHTFQNLRERFTHKAGHTIWGLLNASIIKDELGNPLYFIAQIQDTTERKNAVEALHKSEDHFRILTKVAPVGIYRTTPDYKCVYVNEQWYKMTGLTKEEALGDGWVKGLHPDDRDRIFEEWSNSVRNNKLFQSEYRLRNREGKVIWVYGQAASMEGPTGEIEGFVGTVTDITKRKKAEKELEKLDELKSKFINTISHEMRTPLSKIIGGMDLLEDFLDEKGGDIEKKLFSIIKSGSERLHYIADDMLRIVKAEFQCPILIKEKTSINELVSKVFMEAEYFAGLRKQAMSCALTGEDVWFEGDRGKLHDVLMNLTMNAIKFTPDGGEISISLEQDKDSFRIKIEDSGIGVGDEEKLHIFKKFYGAGNIDHHSTGTFQFNSKGMGLGLPIAKHFVEMHGGKIRVESEGKDKGSAFILEFQQKKP